MYSFLCTAAPAIKGVAWLAGGMMLGGGHSLDSALAIVCVGNGLGWLMDGMAWHLYEMEDDDA